MKRWFMFLIALIISASVGAQSYPPELAGTQANGYWRNLKFIPTEQFQLPWSMPYEGMDVAWLTNLGIGILPPFPAMVEVICLVNLDTGDCIAGPPAPLTVYEWNPDMAAYALIRPNPVDGSAEIEAYSWKTHAWYHYIGHVEYSGHPPQWYDWGWYTLDVANTTARIPPYVQPAEPSTE